MDKTQIFTKSKHIKQNKYVTINSGEKKKEKKKLLAAIVPLILT
jgi:hypothetical protein